MCLHSALRCVWQVMIYLASVSTYAGAVSVMRCVVKNMSFASASLLARLPGKRRETALTAEILFTFRKPSSPVAQGHTTMSSACECLRRLRGRLVHQSGFGYGHAIFEGLRFVSEFRFVSWLIFYSGSYWLVLLPCVVVCFSPCRRPLLSWTGGSLRHCVSWSTLHGPPATARELPRFLMTGGRVLGRRVRSVNLCCRVLACSDLHGVV
jgi:hypothetical protein